MATHFRDLRSDYITAAANLRDLRSDYIAAETHLRDLRSNYITAAANFRDQRSDYITAATKIQGLRSDHIFEVATHQDLFISNGNSQRSIPLQRHLTNIVSLYGGTSQRSDHFTVAIHKDLTILQRQLTKI